MSISFLIMSSVRLPWRSLAIHNTWKHMLESQDVVYFSESNTTYYEAQADQFKLLKHIYMNTSWICLVDDDTFVNIVSLKRMLSRMNSSESLLIGHVLAPYKCLWGGAGMILSRQAYVEITKAIRTRKISMPRGRQRNDVEIVAWASLLNITVIHSNLLWGDSMPESRTFSEQVHGNRDKLHPAIQGAVTMHKMCPTSSCDLMYDTFRIVRHSRFYLS